MDYYELDPRLPFRDFAQKRECRSWSLRPVEIQISPTLAPSEPIFLESVLGHCLYIMMMLTQRLPVRPIPKEFLVSTVWFDMINDCSHSDMTFFITFHTEWIALQELPSLTLPLGTIATLALSFVCKGLCSSQYI